MDSGFREDFINLRLPKRGVERTTISHLQYFSSIVNDNIIVPVGFKTDLGSIPNWLQWLFPKDGRAVLAYIVHDYLYKKGSYSRSISDKIAVEAMGTLDAKWWRRIGVAIGLKIGGWYSWNKHRKEQ